MKVTFASLTFWTLQILVLRNTLSSGSAVIDLIRVHPYYWNSMGSFFGGGRLTIYGNRFDDVTFRNSVMVGDVPCIIDDLQTTPSFLSCRLEPGLINKIGNLPIVVKVKGQQLECVQYFCNYLLNTWTTASISMLQESFTFPGNQLGFYGVFNTADTWSLGKLKLGDWNCVFPEYDNYIDSYLPSNTLWTCQIPEDMPAGSYRLEFSGGYDSGRAVPSKDLTFLGRDDQLYNVKVHPIITSLSKHSGPWGGQVLEIHGWGFGSLASEVAVTVDKAACTILEIESTRIKCRLLPSFGYVKKQLYKGGAGFRHVVYGQHIDDFSPLLAEELADIPVLKNGIILSAANKLEKEKYTQKLWGIFTSKGAGTYKFRISANDNFAMYVSKQPLTGFEAIDPGQDLVRKCYYAYWNQFKIYKSTANQTCTVDMEAGQDYYLTILHSEDGGFDFLSTQVYEPSSLAKPTRDTRTQQVSIDFSVKTVQFEVVIASKSFLNLQFVFTDAQTADGVGSTYSHSSDQFNMTGFSGSELCVFIQSEMGENCVSTLDMIDQHGQLTADHSSAIGYRVTVTYSGQRTKNVLPFVYVDQVLEPPFVTKQKTREQASSVSGYYKLKYGDYVSNAIYYNKHYISLQYDLQRVPLFSDGIEVYQSGSYNTGIKRFFRILPPSADDVDFEVVENKIVDDAGNPVPVSVNPNHLPAENYLVHYTLGSEFMSTAHSSPQVTLTVNGVKAACELGKCDYDVLPLEEVPVITDMKKVDRLLTFDYKMHGASAEPTLDASKLSVHFGDSECSGVSVDNLSFSCTLAEAFEPTFGMFYPNIYYEPIGYLMLQTDGLILQKSEVLASPSSISLGGGTRVSLTGINFSNPFARQPALPAKVIVNNIECELVSSSAEELVVITPPSQNPGLAFVTIQSTFISQFAFLQYDASVTPTITSVTPATMSPADSGSLTISGSHFGTDQSQLTVRLEPEAASGISYDCAVSQLSDTSITCSLQGGRTGLYRVKITKTGIGHSIGSPVTADEFRFAVPVTSVTPSSGSLEGGTTLTISGSSFGVLQHEPRVLIGTVPEAVACDIQTFSETQIVCVTQKPAQAATGPQQISVQSGEYMTSDSDKSITFEFSASATPVITGMTPASAKKGDTVTLTGTGFTAVASDVQILFDEVLVDAANIAVTSATEMTFTVPDVVTGSYSPQVIVGELGLAKYDQIMSISVGVELISVSPSTGSMFGAVLTVSGSGMPTNSTVTVGDTPCEVQSRSPSLITCRTRPTSQKNVKLPVKLKYLQGYAVKAVEQTGVDFTPLTNSPSITGFTNATGFNAEPFTLKLTGEYLKSSGAPTAPEYSPSDVTCKLVLKHTEQTLEVTGSVSFTADAVEVTFERVPAAEYRLEYHVADVGFAAVPGDLEAVLVGLDMATPSEVTSSFAGGARLTLSGKKFPPSASLGLLDVYVCHKKCQVEQSSFDRLVCLTPAFANDALQDSFGLLSPAKQIRAVVTGDQTVPDPNPLFDDDFSTFYSSAKYNDCFLLFDYGPDSLIRSSSIRVRQKNIFSQKIYRGEFQISTDGTSFRSIAEFNSTRYGWTVFEADSPWEFRFLRFTNAGGACGLSELQIWGTTVDQFTRDELACKVTIYQAGTRKYVSGTSAAKVFYERGAIAVIDGISPPMGPRAGGTELTISGSGFGSDSRVLIDGLECATSEVTSSRITCTTPAKTGLAAPSLEIRSSTGYAVNSKSLQFRYYERWSDAATWDSGAPPKTGDVVRIGPGKVVMVDMSPPSLAEVIVEGEVFFEDAKALTFDANSVTVRGGRFLVGSEDSPHTNQLTITLHGRRDSPSTPPFSQYNKGIFVLNGTIHIHGKPLGVTWTFLESTAQAGDSSITLAQEVDWRVGDQIVIAPTSQNPAEAERRTITGKSGKVLMLDSALAFKHFAGEIDPQDPESRDRPFSLRAEVGLLSRNVRIQGDSSSAQSKHGAVVIVAGQNQAEGRFSFVEFARCGQVHDDNPAPLNFHLMRRAPTSYQKHCSVHGSYNRGVNINESMQLDIEHNVFYDIAGHGISTFGGSEEQLTISSNLLVRIKKSDTGSRWERFPAAIVLKNPRNTVTHNHVAGSDQYGLLYSFWYMTLERDINQGQCRQGLKMLPSRGNTIHSTAVGLKINFEYIPNKEPCQGIYNDGPSRFNYSPQFASLFESNVLYMNQTGIRSYYLGAVGFDNHIFVSNGVGPSLSLPGLAGNENTFVRNSVIIGESEISRFHGFVPEAAAHTGGISGLLFSDIRFYNFNQNHLFELCQSCGVANSFDQTAVLTSVEKLRMVNVSAPLLKYRHAVEDMDVLRDKDGSLFRLPESMRAHFPDGGWLTPWLKHLDVPQCTKFRYEPLADADLLICPPEVPILSVRIYSETPSINRDLTLGVSNLGLANAWADVALPVDESLEQSLPFTKAAFPETKFIAANVLVVQGYRYHVRFSGSYQTRRLNIRNNQDWRLFARDQPTYLHVSFPEDSTKVYSNLRALREDNVYRSGKEEGLPFFQFKERDLGESLSFGNFHYDFDLQRLYVKIDQKSRGTAQVFLEACSKNCFDNSLRLNDLEQRLRYWDQEVSWETGYKLPTDQDSLVEIKSGWNMVLNIKTPVIQHLRISGRLVFEGKADGVELHAKIIEIMEGGQLVIGSEEFPYDKQAKIVLHGSQADAHIQVDERIESVNKAVINKGLLSVYAVAPKVQWTRLKVPAEPGQNVVTLVHDDLGWQVGDELVIASSTTNADEYEKVVISQVSANQVTLSAPLQHFHYGAESALPSEQGPIDMRATVGNLSRRVAIEGDTAHEWGCSVLVPALYSGSRKFQGKLKLSGVEIRGCGQNHPNKAAIHIHSTVHTEDAHTVQKSTFNRCLGKALRVRNTSGLTFSDNVVFEASQAGLEFSRSSMLEVHRNLVVGVRSASASEGDALEPNYGIFYRDADPLRASRTRVMDNVVSSVTDLGFGFALPGRDCADSAPISFFGNTAHSSAVGWLATRKSDASCGEFSNFRAYKNRMSGFVQKSGLMHVKVSKLVLADNHVGMSVNASSSSKFGSVTVENSVIIARSLSGFPQLYLAESECSMGGLFTALFERDAFDFLFKASALPLRSSTSDRFSLGLTQTLRNVVFANFGGDAQCVDGSVAIRTNEFAQDAPTFVRLSGIKMQNVPQPNRMHFSEPRKFRSQAAYCGTAQCTAGVNALVHDPSGELQGDGRDRLYLGNNAGLATEKQCGFLNSWNGFDCPPDFGQVLIEDSSWGRKRSLFPLTISAETGFEHVVDGEVESAGLVKLRAVNRLAFGGKLRNNVVYHLVSTQPGDWAVFEVEYRVRTSINVFVDKGRRKVHAQVLPPGAQLDLSPLSSQCGANYFDRDSKKVFFVLTASRECDVTIRFVNAIESKFKLDVSPSDFLAGDGPSKIRQFVSLTAQIDIELVNVIKLVEGSTDVYVQILSADSYENEQTKEAEVRSRLSEVYKTLSSEVRQTSRAAEWNLLEMQDTPIEDFEIPALENENPYSLGPEANADAAVDEGTVEPATPGPSDNSVEDNTQQQPDQGGTGDEGQEQKNNKETGLAPEIVMLITFVSIILGAGLFILLHCYCKIKKQAIRERKKQLDKANQSQKKSPMVDVDVVELEYRGFSVSNYNSPKFQTRENNQSNRTVALEPSESESRPLPPQSQFGPKGSQV